MAMFTSTSRHLSSFVLKYSLIRASPCSSTYPLISSWVNTSQSVSIRSMTTERNFSWVEFKIFGEKVVLIRRKTSREDTERTNNQRAASFVRMITWPSTLFEHERITWKRVTVIGQHIWVRFALFSHSNECKAFSFSILNKSWPTAKLISWLGAHVIQTEMRSHKVQ